MRRMRAVAAVFILIMTLPAQGTRAAAAGDSPGDLYSLSAVLMDGDSGRVLYEKDGETARPNASTTKVLTCLLALENGSGDDYVQISADAAAQPEVKAGLREGEQYYLEDLLYSMMLESHNDSAYAVAETIGGSVENFADMMNARAKQIGCTDTHFITPNGLDASDSGGAHQTTARDLALILRCASKNKTFLKITQTREYAFSDLSKKRKFQLQNTNAFLDMTDGVLCGKTGFTADAGYCYVCACQKGEKTFVVALLGAGWPGNKTWKWKDALALLDYGDENYEYKTFSRDTVLPLIPVRDGVSPEGGLDSTVYVSSVISAEEKKNPLRILCRNGETLSVNLRMKKSLTAPVREGQKTGVLTWILGEETIDSCTVTAASGVQKRTLGWCADWVFENYFH